MVITDKKARSLGSCPPNFGSIKKNIESAWVYKTEIVRKVDGFNEILESGEDKDLFKRINTADTNIEFCLGYNWFHPTPSNLKQYLQRITDYQIKKMVQYRKQEKYNRSITLLFLLISFWLSFPILGSIIGLSKLVIVGLFFAPLFIFYIVRLFNVLKNRKYVSYKRYLYILPLITILTVFIRIYGMILGRLKH